MLPAFGRQINYQHPGIGIQDGRKALPSDRADLSTSVSSIFLKKMSKT